MWAEPPRPKVGGLGDCKTLTHTHTPHLVSIYEAVGVELTHKSPPTLYRLCLFSLMLVVVVLYTETRRNRVAMTGGALTRVSCAGTSLYPGSSQLQLMVPWAGKRILEAPQLTPSSTYLKAVRPAALLLFLLHVALYLFRYMWLSISFQTCGLSISYMWLSVSFYICGFSNNLDTYGSLDL